MKKSRICLMVIAIVGITCIGLLLGNNREKEKDNFVVSIRVPEPEAYNDNGLNFDICVQNLGETPILFEEDNIAQIQINGQAYEFHTEAMTLETAEKFLVSVCIPWSDLRKDGTSNTVLVNAVSVNGTSTAKFTFNQ